jgi:hypothetical protein
MLDVSPLMNWIPWEGSSDLPTLTCSLGSISRPIYPRVGSQSDSLASETLPENRERGIPIHRAGGIPTIRARKDLVLPGLVAHTYSASYLGGWSLEPRSSRPACVIQLSGRTPIMCKALGLISSIVKVNNFLFLNCRFFVKRIKKKH